MTLTVLQVPFFKFHLYILSTYWSAKLLPFISLSLFLNSILRLKTRQLWHMIKWGSSACVDPIHFFLLYPWFYNNVLLWINL